MAQTIQDLYKTLTTRLLLATFERILVQQLYRR